MFRTKTLDGILSSFDRLAKDLEGHINTKVVKTFSLHSIRDDIEKEIKALDEEVDRAARVLSKVTELVS